jgi:hypothetical protein
MNRNFTRLFTSVVALIAMGNTGCTKFLPAGLAQSGLSLSSQCQSQSVSRALASYSVQDACENSANYVCDSQTFSSTAASSSGVEVQCANVTGWGQVCVTMDASTTAEPSDTSDVTVIHCANTEVSNPGVFLFQATADSLELALSSAVQKCRTGSL